MKTTNLSRDHRSIIVNILKAGTVLLWLTILLIAGINGQLIEAFLLTLSIGVISYFLFSKNNENKKKIAKNSFSTQNFNTEEYMRVFF